MTRARSPKVEQSYTRNKQFFPLWKPSILIWFLRHSFIQMHAQKVKLHVLSFLICSEAAVKIPTTSARWQSMNVYTAAGVTSSMTSESGWLLPHGNLAYQELETVHASVHLHALNSHSQVLDWHSYGIHVHMYMYTRVLPVSEGNVACDMHCLFSLVRIWCLQGTLYMHSNFIVIIILGNNYIHVHTKEDYCVISTSSASSVWCVVLGNFLVRNPPKLASPSTSATVLINKE